MDLPREPWVCLLGSDPRARLLASEEPEARWVALTQILDLPDHDPHVIRAHDGVLADPRVQQLIDSLPDWEVDVSISGHNSPGFAPNLLHLLADMGVRAGDSARIDHLLDQFLLHQERTGRFAAYGKAGHGDNRLTAPVWGSLLCDSHAIVEALIRFGRGGDQRTKAALARMAEDVAPTAQGPAWPCVPHSVSEFRGPGRRGDLCPQVTLEALRAFARLPDGERPPCLLEIARTALAAWRRRSWEKPYMFGHGYNFKIVKWPAFWYDIHLVLDTLGGYPDLWRGEGGTADDRQAVAELVACMVRYNFGEDGMVTPRSCYRGFSRFSFGQKKLPSPFATARLVAVLRRFGDLVHDALAVDVLSLASSKGGSGAPRPPRR